MIPGDILKEGVTTRKFADIARAYTMPVLARMLLMCMLRAAFGGDDDEDSLLSQFAWGMADGLAAPLPLVRDLVGVGRYVSRAATVPAISVPARSLSQAGRGLNRLGQGETEAAGVDFARAMAIYLPLYTPLRQLSDAGKRLGHIEEEE